MGPNDPVRVHGISIPTGRRMRASVGSTFCTLSGTPAVTVGPSPL
jgi:hypothetical protein